MLVKEFITDSLERIHKAFPKSRLEYQFKTISNTHFIKVLPKSYFSEDTFIDLDFELTDLFRDQDFNGSLCFLTEDSLVELDNPSIVIHPENPYVEFLELLTENLSQKITFGDSTIQTPKVDCPILFNEIGNQRFAVAA